MKAQFLTPLRVEHIGTKWWRLTSDLVYFSALLDKTVTTPAGFVTDFASVPRLPFAYWLFGSRANAPAVVHDRAYRWGDISRCMADRVFNEAMKSEGKVFFLRWPMTAAVMSMGWVAHKNRYGCLDHRHCQYDGTGAHCYDCEHYFRGWSK